MTGAVRSVELILSEFGASRRNCGSARLDFASRFDPALSSFKRVFPDAAVAIYTDQDMVCAGAAVHKVDPPFDMDHPRAGWRAHDYYQIQGLLKSTADVAIAMDADFEVVSDDFAALPLLAEAFGLCVPLNPRLLLRVDGGIGADSRYREEADPTRGTSLAYNLSPIAFATAHGAARALLADYARRMEDDPGRGAVHLSQASLDLGFQPHVLAPQWCVSSPRDLDSKHIWDHPIALHVGHRDVWPRLRRERRIARAKSLLKRWLGR